MLFFMGKQADIAGYTFYFREWGHKLGVRQADVIKQTGLNKGYVSLLWSRKGGKDPSPDVVARIAKSFDIHMAAILVSPDSPEGRTFLAMGKIPKEKQNVVVEMLEGFAQRA